MAEAERRTTVVVGAGSSGCVVASRLTEDEREHVVLIEAGPDFAGVADLPEALSDADNPSLWGHDWDHPTYFVEGPDIRDVGRYPRGRVMGGTSAVNAAIALRGIPEDYDEWASLGNDEWGWASVLPHFVKLERDEDFGGQPYHGTDGPVSIAREWADTWPEALRALARGFEREGFPPVDDHNRPGAAGIGPTPRNKFGSRRASASVAYLQDARNRPNLDVLSEALVTRVLVRNGRAEGVAVQRNGQLSEIRADRVVLSGGAINTPQLLMLSGIGPKDVLEVAGVEVVLDVPGVGRNLQDHANIPLIFAVLDESESRFGFRLHLRYSSGEPGSPPNDIYSTPGYIRTASMNFATNPGVSAALMVNPAVAKPRGSGWLHITSANPSDHPEIRLNYLADESDFIRLLKAVRLFLDVLAAEPVASQIGRALVAPGADDLKDDESLRDWMLRNVNTAFHAAGTCRMGPDGDHMAVLDQRLRVRGVKGLFVADASVMPTITTGFTNIPCYMIGERLAGWLRQEA